MVLKTWETRNTTVQKLYTDIGHSREHAILIQAASHEISDLEALPFQDRGWANKSQGALKKMHVNSIKTFITTIKKLKRWFKKQNKCNITKYNKYGQTI